MLTQKDEKPFLPWLKSGMWLKSSQPEGRTAL